MTSSSNTVPDNVTGDTRTAKIKIILRNIQLMISAPFNGANWLTWSRSVRIALEGKDRLVFIDRSCVKPTEGSIELKQWITDSLVRTWILRTMTKDIVNAFLYASSARTLWLELKARYGESDGPLVYKIRREINSITQGNLTVTTYYTNLKQYWDELICLKPPAMCSYGQCICNSNTAKQEEIEEDHLMQFLMGLSEPYDNIRSQILVLDPLPSVDKAYSMILRVERQRRVNMEYADVGEASAMHARGQRGFMKKRGTVDKRNMICDYCNKTGHGRDTCFKLHGVPEWYRDLNEQKKRGSINRAYAAAETQNNVNRPTPQEADLVSDLLEALKTIQSNKVLQDPVQVHFARDMEMAGMSVQSKLECHGSRYWIVDTGATNHMCGDISLFHSLTPLHIPVKVHLPNNSIVDATHQGDIILSPTLDLTSKKPIAIGTQTGKLKYVTWHKRLGHPSPLVLTRIRELNIDEYNKSCVCPVCPLAKQSRQSFPSNAHHAVNSFDLIHIDIWGPYKQPSLSGCHYVLTIVDDHSRVTWTYLMKHKSQTLHILGSFIFKVATQFNSKIEVVRTDNGSEFSMSSVPESTGPILVSTHTLDNMPTPTTILDSETSTSVPAEPSPSSIPPVDTVPELPLRRSTRQQKTPAWLSDFQCNHSSASFIDPNTLASSHADGSIDRYKARLVAKGYNQVEGVDYVDRFSPVAQSGDSSDFLGFGIQLHLANPSGFEWTSKLLSFGFHQSAHDHCLFLKHTEDGMLALLVNVDDVLITYSSEARITEVKHFLDSAFTIKDLGLEKYFLGLEIARSPSGTSITQHKFIRNIIRDAGLLSAKPASSPLPPELKLSAHTSPPLSDAEPYRRLVGRLLYLSFTRPDISFGAQQLSQFVHAPCAVHLDAAMHLVRYLKGCPERGLFFPAHSSLSLTAYCDADWASYTDSRRSLTGYCIFLGNALISWKMKKQSTIARSTAEAEYRSLGSTVCELQWITYLLTDLQVHVPTPISLYCDNQAAMHIVANPVFHERTKHLKIDCHLVRDKFKADFVLPMHISGTDQLADVFTKSLSGSQFFTLLSKLALVSFPQVHLEGG
ncbi:UNVERIFIED_CONTAM: Retrovirus-related Pol polyprotein from transposon RE1 [Sesamum latifolium]|uniref:Retrovirus-related Pol polyprotein from transposon RE1 n=1 Tax=Sesamum latifolium TaxID=2727402 RepID=A0AAW2WWR7_9LAMI